MKATDLLLPDQKQSLGEFLSVCDMVKFARYEPGPTELRSLYDSAVRLIDETEPRLAMAPSDPQRQARRDSMNFAHPYVLLLLFFTSAGLVERAARAAAGVPCIPPCNWSRVSSASPGRARGMLMKLRWLALALLIVALAQPLADVERNPDQGQRRGYRRGLGHVREHERGG